MDIKTQKDQLRSFSFATRPCLPDKDKKKYDNKISGKVLQFIQRQGFKKIAGYYPINREVDLSELYVNLWLEHYQLGLPAIPDSGQLLEFIAWREEDRLIDHKFKTKIPDHKEALEPDCILVPLLAFDEELNRLGYGKGYFDYTLSHLASQKKGSICSIGIAYGFQKLESVPTDEFDVKLDYIITEKKIYSL